MPIAQMAADADPVSPAPPTEKSARDPGAPIPKDEIDPDLIKLKRPRTRIGVITSAGVVVLCAYFLVRLTPDRRFAGESAPTQATTEEIGSGLHDEDTLISVSADLVMSQAIRPVKARGDLGHRVTPTRGTQEKLWIAFPGDGWERPSPGAYTGRLRKLAELPFADATIEYARSHPRPVFAAVAAVRAGLSTNQVTTVTGDTIVLHDSDRVAFDTIDPTASTLVVTFTPETKEHGPLKDVAAWTAELAKHGITATPVAQPAGAQADKLGQSDALLGQARFLVGIPNAELTKLLENAKLWASRVEPVTKHYDTTWGALRGSTAAGFVVGQAMIPDGQLDLMGFYVGRSIPSDAWVVLVGEQPEDYWYVMPITIVLGIIGLLFGWALVRAVRRDILPTRA